MPEEAVGLDDDISLSPEEQLNVRIAWYYYITEMTQQQIADRFNLTRVRVNKALALNSESGIVQIRINSKLASCIELENKLVRHYGLKEAIVVPTPEDERFIYRVLAVGAAPYIHDQLKEVILVSGGLYKSEITRAVLRRKLVQVLVIDEATAQRLLC